MLPFLLREPEHTFQLDNAYQHASPVTMTCPTFPYHPGLLISLARWAHLEGYEKEIAAMSKYWLLSPTAGDEIVTKFCRTPSAICISLWHAGNHNLNFSKNILNAYNNHYIVKSLVIRINRLQEYKFSPTPLSIKHRLFFPYRNYSIIYKNQILQR